MGLVHIYFGDGKGKTTAALGLALRALGDGFRVCVCQFLKSAKSGETEALKRFESAVLLRAEERSGKFLWQMNEKERAAATEADLYVLDEALDAVQVGAFSLDALLERTEALRERAEIVITGHDAPEALLSRADYITRMQKLRHPYDHGTSARRGIEY